MGNVIVGVVILAIVALATLKIIIEKKKGAKCIGCPYSQSNGNCNCK
jgi:hypothetical protein